jgi:hypothetical protein
MQHKQKSKYLTTVPSWTYRTEGKRVDDGVWVQVEDERLEGGKVEDKGERVWFADPLQGYNCDDRHTTSKIWDIV